MKLAWLVYDSEYDTWQIFFEEPRHYSGSLIPIVYSVVET
jgi:hypothetical protein